ALHVRRCGVVPAKITDADASPDCFAYTNFLMAAAHHDAWEVLVAALLPCFLIYWVWGCAVGRVAAPTNPYRAWIDTYADEGFGEAVRTVIAITDRAATAA